MFRRRRALDADHPAGRGLGGAPHRRSRRWSTPGSPTARASTPSSRPWRSTGPRSRSAASAHAPLRHRPPPGVRLDLPGDDRLPQGRDRRPRQHHDQRRHGGRQDDALEQPVGLHSCRRAAGDDRRFRRVATAAETRGPHGNAAADIRGLGRRGPPRPGAQRLAHAARPHHPGRSPRRRGARHAPGHEHGPRRLADDHPRQRHPRCLVPLGSHGEHGGLRAAGDGRPPLYRFRDHVARAPGAAQGRRAAGDADLRDHGPERRRLPDPRYLFLPTGGAGRSGAGGRPLPGHGKRPCPSRSAGRTGHPNLPAAFRSSPLERHRNRFVLSAEVPL